MAKHTIILGHGSGDPGALGKGITERAMLEKLGKSLLNTIKVYGLDVQVIDDHNVLRKGNLLKYKGTTVTELHYNAFNGSAHGTEVLIKKGFKPDAMDNRLLNALSKYWRNRGFKYRSDLGNMNKAASNGINYRLVEICFIDNVGDMSVMDLYMGQIGTALLQAITGLTDFKPANPVKKPATIPSSKKYYIQTGVYSVESNARLHLEEVKKHFPDAFIKEV